jgi:hypothetical protein
VRTLAVSDEVAGRLWTPEVQALQPDLIVSCGDVPFDLLGWLARVPDAPLVFAPGNHDPDLSGYRPTPRGLVLPAGLAATRREAFAPLPPRTFPVPSSFLVLTPTVGLPGPTY